MGFSYKAVMNLFICPLCAEPLSQEPACSNHPLRCVNNHCFDIAKEGYVNLLPVQKKKSKEPGDSPEMIQARRAFLNAGFYTVLAQGVLELLAEQLEPDMSILDLGCGEGYYTRYLHQKLSEQGGFELYGIDISKTAIRYAAKQYPAASYAVANAFELPFADGSIDKVLQIYAYGNPQEISRVLKPEGEYIIVSPNENHLLELKQRIYDKVNTHELPEPPEGFEAVSTQRISDTITPDTSARANLLKMTPFYWAAVKEKQEKIEQAEPFSISLDFTIQVLRPISPKN